MSDTPVTLYRLSEVFKDTELESRAFEKAGEFVSRPWCKVHDLPMAVSSPDAWCYYYHEDTFMGVPECEPTRLPIRVEVYPMTQRRRNERPNSTLDCETPTEKRGVLGLHQSSRVGQP